MLEAMILLAMAVIGIGAATWVVRSRRVAGACDGADDDSERPNVRKPTVGEYVDEQRAIHRAAAEVRSSPVRNLPREHDESDQSGSPVDHTLAAGRVEQPTVVRPERAAEGRRAGSGDDLGPPLDPDRPILVDWSGSDDPWRSLLADVTDPDGPPRLLILDCEGVQVGSASRQVNVYQYRIDASGVDFDDVLAEPDVLRALVALAAEPDKPGLLAAAEQAMATVARRAVIDLEEIVGIEIDRPARPGRLPQWPQGRAILVTGCSGVQLQDHARQNNRFVYTVSPTKAGAALLAANPRLVHALAVLAARPRAADSSFRRAVGSALTNAVRATDRDRDDVARHVRSLGADGVVTMVAGVQGVQVGGRQVNRTRIGTVHRPAAPAFDAIHDQARELQENEPIEVLPAEPITRLLVGVGDVDPSREPRPKPDRPRRDGGRRGRIIGDSSVLDEPTRRSGFGGPAGP